MHAFPRLTLLQKRLHGGIPGSDPTRSARRESRHSLALGNVYDDGLRIFRVSVAGPPPRDLAPRPLIDVLFTGICRDGRVAIYCDSRSRKKKKKKTENDQVASLALIPIFYVRDESRMPAL